MSVSSRVLSGCGAVSGLAWSAGSLIVDPGGLAIGGVELDALMAAGAFAAALWRSLDFSALEVSRLGCPMRLCQLD